jgi:hypothetical protein
MAKIAVAGIFAFGLAVVAGAGWARLHAPPASAIGPRAAARPTGIATTAPALFASPRGKTTAPLTSAAATAAWRGIVSYLESTRVQAFASGRPALLATVYAPDAPGLAVDAASVTSLVTRGLHVAGFAATVERVKLMAETSDTVTLQVVDRLSSYRLVDVSGTTVATGSGRAARAFTMRLAKTPTGWRIATIVP